MHLACRGAHLEHGAASLRTIWVCAWHALYMMCIPVPDATRLQAPPGRTLVRQLELAVSMNARESAEKALELGEGAGVLEADHAAAVEADSAAASESLCRPGAGGGPGRV